MSRYSGRSDLYDVLVMIHQYTEEELKNNVKIYVGDSCTPLKIESKKDIIPYYTHLIGSSYSNNVKRTQVIHLTSESSVDTEERKFLESYLNQILKIYNRCKRKKIEFSVEDAVKEVCWNNWHKEQITEIANRVKEKGKNATLDNIHLTMQEYYRQELVDEMLKNGLNPAEYGYERFIKGSVKND